MYITFRDFLNEKYNESKPIKKLIINGIDITKKDINWETLYKSKKYAEVYATQLYLDGKYPDEIKEEVEKRFGKQKWYITPSGDIKYRIEKLKNPKRFK